MAKKLAPPLALVAGASGIIGNHVGRHLQNQGIRVRALVRSPAQLTSCPEEIFVGNIQNAYGIEGSWFQIKQIKITLLLGLLEKKIIYQ